MSKNVNIYRAWINGDGAAVVPDDRKIVNCTVVHDDAGIPVKEALEVVKATEWWYLHADESKAAERRGTLRMCIAMGKYRVAAERMKKKKAKKS